MVSCLKLISTIVRRKRRLEVDAGIKMQDMLPDLPGTILQRQTTFIDLQLTEPTHSSVHTYRIHYRSKLEFQLGPIAFNSVRIVDEHPLLLDYSEEHGSIWLWRGPDDGFSLLSELNGLCNTYFQGWRRLDRYVNGPFQSPNILTGCRFGVFLVAPSSFISRACPILNRHRVVYEATTGGLSLKPARVLLLDSMFVVAEDFKVVGIPSTL